MSEAEGIEPITLDLEFCKDLKRKECNELLLPVNSLMKVCLYRHLAEQNFISNSSQKRITKR